MGSNQSYEQCIREKRKNLRYPIDSKSLYGNRIYDNQTANRLCYEKNPVPIVEGFGTGGMDLESLMKYAILGIIIFIVISYLMRPSENVSVGIDSATIGGADTTEFFDQAFRR